MVMKRNVLIGVLFLIVSRAICAMDNNPVFIQIKLHSENLDELVIRMINPDTHASLCARMCQEQPAFPGVYMVVKSDAIELFKHSLLLHLLRQVEPESSNNLTFRHIIQNQHQQN